jgi:hypothetical protein
MPPRFSPVSYAAARADQAARRAASARAGQRGRERTGDDQTKTRDDDRRADREDGSQSRPHTAADRAPGAEPLGRLGSGFQLGTRLDVAEVPLPCLVGHEDVDVVRLVAMRARQALIRAAGRFR